MFYCFYCYYDCLPYCKQIHHITGRIKEPVDNEQEASSDSY